MRRTALALAFGLVVALAGCTHTAPDGTVTTGFRGFAYNIGALVGGAPVTKSEANTVAAAANLYNAASKVALAYIINVKPPRDVRDRIAFLSGKAREYLDLAIDANVRGDSAAVDLAMRGFNDIFPQFTGYLREKGAYNQ